MVNGSCGSGFNKGFSSAKTVRIGFLEASGMRFDYILQDSSRDSFIYFIETMELFIADFGIDPKIGEVNIALQLLVYPLVYVAGLLQDWYYNEQPTDRPAPGTYIRTCWFLSTILFHIITQDISRERHQGIQGSGLMRKTDVPVLPMAKLQHRYTH